MTLIVGILCADGVVVASDSATTLGALGQHTIKQDSQKLEILHGSIVLGCSGFVGLKQKITGAVSDATENNKLGKLKPHEAMGRLTDVIRAQVKPELEMAAIASKSLGQTGLASAIALTVVAMPLNDRASLFQFDQQAAGEQATLGLPFVAIGSGGHNADVFLAFLRRTFWPTQLPALSDGTFAAVWCLHHAILVDPGGVSGSISVATVAKEQKWRARMLEQDEIDDHIRAVTAAEDHLRAFKAQLGAPGTAGAVSQPPAPPEPPKE